MPALTALRLLPFALLLSAALTSTAHAAQPSQEFRQLCESRLPRTSIKVVAHPSDIEYSFTEGVLDLTRKSKAAPGTFTLGVTYRAFKLSSEWEGSFLKDPDSELSCARPKLRLDLRVGPQKVAVAKEFPYDTCAFWAIAEHELRHVNANQQQVEKVAGELERTLVRTFADHVFYGTPQELRESFTTNLRDEWLPWAGEKLEEVEHVHHHIDSPQEYARTQTLCNGDISRVVRKLQRR